MLITFKGILKGDNGSRHHLKTVLSMTASTLNFMWWLERLNDELIRKGQRNGPSCYNEEGNLDQALK